MSTATTGRQWAWRALKALLVLVAMSAVWAAYIALRERPHGTPEQQQASRTAHQDREVRALPVDERPVLILLHGAGLNARMWDPIIRKLDPHVRVVALDLPGHGVRRDEVFTLEAAQALVIQVAQSVAPAPVVLAGDSLGGYVAMASASGILQEQLRGLVLAGCSANFDPADRWRVWRQLTMARLTMAVTSEERLATLALNRFAVAPETQQKMRESGLRLWAVEEAFEALRPVDFKTLLSRIQQPVLIVNGDGDLKAIAHEAEFLAVAQQGTSHRFVGTGHGVSLLRGADFAGLINAFTHQVLSH